MRKYLIVIILFLTFSKNVNAKYNDLTFMKNFEEHKTISSAVGISLNSKGEIALGFKDKFINVYDINGKFICCYSFYTSGSYVFEYDKNDNIMIFPIRSDACFFYDTNAKLIKTTNF
jgi:hypothetical protein